MKKHILPILLVLGLLPTWVTAAEVDMTSKLVNPSFELDNAATLTAVNSSADGLRGYTLTKPNGWTVGGTAVTELLVNKNCYTDNNFGQTTTIANGTQAYYLRQGWAGGSTTLTQSVTLSAGRYRLTVDQRNAYANSALSSFYLVAGTTNGAATTFNAGSNGCMTSMAWTTSSLEFTLDADATINLGVTVNWVSGGSCIMFDNFRLYKDETTYTAMLQNPSFEADAVSKLTADGNCGYKIGTNITGWTLTGSYARSNIMTAATTETDNNYGAPGTPSNGTQMYYLRQAWTNGTTTLLQTITLPAARYRLSVDTKLATAGGHSVYLVAGDESTPLTFLSAMPTAWTTGKIEFELTKQTTISVGIRVNWTNSAGGSIVLDNFRLDDITDEVVAPEPDESAISSPTEGLITTDFVPESVMKSDLLQMLANFSKYMVNDYMDTSNNSKGEACGYFKGENSGSNGEQGVRPNADLSMICAFLVKYGKPAGVTLPSGVTWATIESIAMKSLVYAYSTHKANKFHTCTGNNYWGSTSTSDFVWESSLWAMSVAYSAFFQWNKLSTAQKGYIEAMLKAECNYELYRSIPTGYNGDTKSEENGWEVDILAATLGLFPNDALASKWFDRMREFAINSYSHVDDAMNHTVIDPWYDNKTVADLYKGPNLYDDYSLQNHNLFHTSYQNVVMQELGEAALALKMFQRGIYGTEQWKSNALMHHNQEVQDSILNWLALPDGELAMPNGNDWSLFLYDQITSYTTQACFQRDPNALMLENQAYKYIKARQKTTTDGSWLLRPDVGARRMGVEGHRVMMTWLMHDQMSTSDLTPTNWDDFNHRYSKARTLTCQNVVRASTDSRFTCFSWSNGIKSYTGYFAANSADKNKIVVPYRANNTGNITGWYEVNGKGTNATPVMSGAYQCEGNGFVMNGELNTNDASLNNRFVLYSTPQNAIIYLDYITANANVTINADKSGLLAISTDELTKLTRTLYYNKNNAVTHTQSNGAAFTQYNTDWMNIDNELGIVCKDSGKKFAFGDRSANNSIFTSKLYPLYSNTARAVTTGSVVDSHNIVYYSLQTAEETARMAEDMTPLKGLMPAGWNAIIAPDADRAYFLAANFKGAATANINGIQYKGMAPIFRKNTTVTDSKASVQLSVYQNYSYAQPLTIFATGTDFTAIQSDETEAYFTANANTTIKVAIAKEGSATMAESANKTLAAGQTVKAYLQDGQVVFEETNLPDIKIADYTDHIVNPSYQGNSNYGWNGTPAVNFGTAEKFNTTYDVNQTITNLPKGNYLVTCQGFYRAGTYAAATTAHKAGTEKLNALLYANDASVPLQSIIDEAGKKGNVGVLATGYGYIPDNMEQSDIYFRAGLYNNSLLTTVGDDGVLKLGIKKTASIASDWTIWDNFTLTRIEYGDVDCSGEVSLRDLTVLVNMLRGVTPTLVTGEVNGQNPIDLNDVDALVGILENK